MVRCGSGIAMTLGGILFVTPLVALAEGDAAGRVAGPRIGRAIRHDVSPPLAEMARPVPPPSALQIEIPLRAPSGRQARPDHSGGPDPLRQAEARPFPEAAPTPQPSLNVPGLSDDDNASLLGFRIVPPDTEGDVGPDHYVQWINLIFAVYDKGTGAIVSGGGPFAGNSLWSGFGGECEATNDGDPIVLYDHLADRWLFSQFAIDSGTQCVALSTGSDPRGPYQRWEFVVTPGGNNDYPKLGVWPDAYYLSTRDFNFPTFAGATAFDRAAMLAGDPDPQFVSFGLDCLANDCPDGIQPAHLEGPAPAAGAPNVYSRAWDDDFDGPLTGADGYRLWAFSVDWAGQDFSFTELPFVPSSGGFDSTMCGFFQRNCIRQPNPGERLDPIDELQMYRAQYRHFPTHDALLLNVTVDATGSNVAGVRWAELRKSGTGWALFQDGTYAPGDGRNRWMGSAAMNGFGDIAVGYSVSSNDTRPSIRYVTRTAADALGTLPGGEVELIAGTGVQQSSSSRWGDYSAMSVDPVDDCTFWYTQEYYENNGSFDFKTRIGSFAGPSCGGGGCVPDEDPEVSCSDGLDNDCDGLTDGDDPDCAACVPTHPKEKGPRCSDGLDNDCDGLIDGDDPDC